MRECSISHSGSPPLKDRTTEARITVVKDQGWMQGHLQGTRIQDQATGKETLGRGKTTDVIVFIHSNCTKYIGNILGQLSME